MAMSGFWITDTVVAMALTEHLDLLPGCKTGVSLPQFNSFAWLPQEIRIGMSAKPSASESLQSTSKEFVLTNPCGSVVILMSVHKSPSISFMKSSAPLSVSRSESKEEARQALLVPVASLGALPNLLIHAMTS